MNKKYLLFGAVLAVLLIVTAIKPLVGLLAIAAALAAYALFGMRDAEPEPPQFPRPGPERVPEFIPHNEAPPPPLERSYLAPPPPPLAHAEPAPPPEPEPVPEPVPHDQPSPRWIKPDGSLAERVAKLIATQAMQLGALFRSDKCSDCLLTDEQARLVTTANSAINRHGTMIEDVILQTLKDCKRFRVWKSRKLGTDEANGEEGGHRRMDVDLVVFDPETHCVTGYEVKRNTANAQDVARKLTAALPLLIREAEAEGFIAIKADVAVISYFGGLRVHGFEVITGETIDTHFGCSIRAEVEKATAKLRAELQGLFRSHRANDRRAA